MEKVNCSLLSFFLFFIMDSIQGRNWKVGLDENTGLTCKHLGDGKLCLCLHSLITEEVEERAFSPPALSCVYIRLC